jgi:peptidoglycan/xylan/chitin deacetylase (PgdA/CDA1 family)
VKSLKKLIKRTMLAPLVVERVRGASQGVALTFDDGPDPRHTDELLDVFRRRGGLGTFFLVGERAAAWPGIVDRIVADGHEIGNHSWSHAEVDGLGYSGLREEIGFGDAALARARWARGFRGLFRPPKGALTGTSLLYAALHRRPHVLWSIDPRDYRAGSAREVLDNIHRHRYRGGDIILLHDTNGYTAEAVDGLLEDMARRGLQAVTVSELLGRGPSHAPESPGSRPGKHGSDAAHPFLDPVAEFKAPKAGLDPRGRAGKRAMREGARGGR